MLKFLLYALMKPVIFRLNILSYSFCSLIYTVSRHPFYFCDI